MAIFPFHRGSIESEPCSMSVSREGGLERDLLGREYARKRDVLTLSVA